MPQDPRSGRMKEVSPTGLVKAWCILGQPGGRVVGLDGDRGSWQPHPAANELASSSLPPEQQPRRERCSDCEHNDK